MNPYVFDNNYYMELLKKDSYYIKTPSDQALLNDSSMLAYIEEFSKDQKSFFDEFANVYLKLSRLGQKELKSESAIDVNFAI